MNMREDVVRVSCWGIACLLGLVAASCVAYPGSSETIEVSTDLPPLAAERLGAGVVLGDDGRIYVFGGYRYNYTSWDSTTNTVMIYNISTGATSYGTSMSNGVAWPSCAKLPDGRIVVIGGYDSTVTNGTMNVRIYSPQGNSWTTNASAPTNISKAGTALGNDGKVYVFGPQGSPNSTLIYDPVGDAWSYGADMPGNRDRYSSSVVTYNDTAIYVIGGHRIAWIWIPPSTWLPIPTDTNFVDIYDPTTDSWTSGSPLNTAKHSGGAAIAKDGCIHYYGGQQWIGICYDEIETLDVSASGANWQVSNCTISREKAHFGTVADEYGRVFLVGGMEFPTYSGVDEVEMLLTAEVSEVSEIIIASPMDGTEVNGTVEITVEVKNQHQASVVVVDMYVDDDLLESQLGGGATAWTFLWNASDLPLDSYHDVLVRAFFSDGSVSVDEASYVVVTELTDEGIDERLSQIEDDLAAVLANISDLASSIDALENLTGSLLENVSILRDDVILMRDDIQSNLSSVQTEIGEIQSQLDALADAMAELESSTAADLSGLSADVTSLSEALDTLTATVLDMQAALDALAQQPGLDLDEVMDDLDSIMDAVEELNRTVDEVDGSVGEAQSSADSASTYALLAMIVAVFVLAAFAVSTLVLRKKP